MSDATTAFLREHGIHMTPAELDAAVAAAVRARRARLSESPRAELTPTQAANLEAGGLDLTPHGANEELQADRTSADYAALIRTSYTTRSLATLLDRNASWLRKRIQAGTLYAFQVDGDWYIPAFQVHERELLPGLAHVVQSLRPGLHPLKLERWFLMPNPDLSDAGTWTPRDWLIAGGDPAHVAELAAHL